MSESLDCYLVYCFSEHGIHSSLNSRVTGFAYGSRKTRSGLGLTLTRAERSRAALLSPVFLALGACLTFFFVSILPPFRPRSGPEPARFHPVNARSRPLRTQFPAQIRTPTRWPTGPGDHVESPLEMRLETRVLTHLETRLGIHPEARDETRAEDHVETGADRPLPRPDETPVPTPHARPDEGPDEMRHGIHPDFPLLTPLPVPLLGPLRIAVFPPTPQFALCILHFAFWIRASGRAPRRADC
jgi:hypothetical protein